jgi:hypothetical protein
MKVSLRHVVVLAVVFVAGAVVGLPTVRPVTAGASAAGGDSSTVIEDLLAKDAIRAQIYNYSRGIDRLDKALTLQVWHPDGTADYGGQQTTGPQFVEGLFKSLPNMVSSAHHMLDTVIKVSGDKAVSETYANSSLVLPLQGKEGVSISLIRGRYADRWSERDGRWALDHRAYIEDFRTAQDVLGKAPLGRGKRDHTDLSYPIYAAF